MLEPPTVEERVAAAREHLERSLDWKGPKLGVLEMRRHYTNYFRGFPGIKSYRATLVAEHDPEVLFATLKEIEKEYDGVESLVS
ncbi:MAG: tRNA-dihydrouridine synthase [Saprospiraceae bacterium]